MQAVEILAQEHRAIACVLTCLERLLQATIHTDSLDGEAAAEILEYLERVADGCHQDKEENVVFPKLLEHTTADVRRFVDELLGDHQRERSLLEQLRANLEAAAYGDALSRDSFVTLAREYVSKLCAHAQWEDEILLPFAEEYLGEQEDAEMLAGYLAVEAHYFAGERRSPRELLERIQARSGVAERQVIGSA